MSDTINPVGKPKITVLRDSSTPVESTEYDRSESPVPPVVAVPKSDVDGQAKSSQ